MKVYVVYGPPCGGKSTYIKDHAQGDDAIWDADDVLCAITTRDKHTCEEHPMRQILNRLRKDLVDHLTYYNTIDTLWFQCRWPYDWHMELFTECDVEEIPMIPTKDECLERLEDDDTRPDKDAWKEVIEEWYEEHDQEEETEGGENRVDNKKFWNWITRKATDEAPEERILVLNGAIASESWWDDEVTPEDFRKDLNAGSGDITVWINSPGGDCVAAAQIYNMLMEYKGNVTIKIDGIAASAASVIAMAGTKVLMSPVSMMMIHNPSTIAWGDKDEMKRAIQMLSEVKESIINAYEIKTGLERSKISNLMDTETWMNANKAVELGFADGVLERTEVEDIAMPSVSMMCSAAEVTNSLMGKIAEKCRIEKPEPKNEPVGRSADELRARLNEIKKFI